RLQPQARVAAEPAWRRPPISSLQVRTPELEASLSPHVRILVGRGELYRANRNRQSDARRLRTTGVQLLPRRRCRHREPDQKRQARVEARNPSSAALPAMVRIPTAIGPDAWCSQNNIRLSSPENCSAADWLT